jgi:hypothetical protein
LEGAALLTSLAHEGLDYVVCAHLSEVNNDPGAVYKQVHMSLIDSGFENVSLMIGGQHTPGPLLELRDDPLRVIEKDRGGRKCTAKI